jgi:hypothetical protein
MQRFAWMGCVGWIGLLVSECATAAELFRCETPAGAVSYQDVPCAAGSRLTKTIEVPGVAGEGERGATKQSKKAKPTTRSKGAKASSARPAKADGKTRQRQACAEAKVERDRVLEGLGLERTFEHLRALDDRVQAVCKGL